MLSAMKIVCKPKNIEVQVQVTLTPYRGNLKRRVTEGVALHTPRYMRQVTGQSATAILLQ